MIQGTSTLFDFEQEILKIRGHLKRYKQRQSCGDKSTATIQVCIKMRNRIINDESVLNWCSKGILTYMTWLRQFVNDTQRYAILENTISGHKSDNVKPEVRAIGLLLWDAIHIKKNKFVDVEKYLLEGEQAEKQFLDHRRKKADPRQLRRDLILTEYCVDNMEVLTQEDLKQSRRWSPNIRIAKNRKRKQGTT